jgi:ketosteroid isomerase-like protein
MADGMEAHVRAIWERYKLTGDPGFDDNFDPEIEWHLRADLPDSRTLRGHEQVKRMFAEWADAFEDFDGEPVDISDVAGRTIVVIHLRGRIKGSGQTIEMDEVWVYSWRGEKVIEIHEYRTKDEALRSLESSVEPGGEGLARDPG